MTITEMLGQSGLLTLLGMCVVFSFIIILIICMKALQTVLHALKLDKMPEKAPAQIKKQTNAPTQKTDNNAIVAAIAVALYERTR